MSSATLTMMWVISATTPVSQFQKSVHQLPTRAPAPPGADVGRGVGALLPGHPLQGVDRRRRVGGGQRR